MKNKQVSIHLFFLLALLIITLGVWSQKYYTYFLLPPKAKAASGTLTINPSSFTTTGSITTGKFIDSANSSYFLDPYLSSAGTSLAIAGNAGIGTTAPKTLLHVDGEVKGKALVVLNQTGNQAILEASTSGTSKFTINNSGNVGIGTTSPGAPLVVQSLTEQMRLSYQDDGASYTAFSLDANDIASISGVINTGATCATNATCPFVTFSTLDVSENMHIYVNGAQSSFNMLEDNQWRVRSISGDFQIRDQIATAIRLGIIDGGVFNLYDTNDIQAQIQADASAKNDNGWQTGVVDYAEFMEKLNKQENIEVYEVVGIKNGKITKETNGVMTYMVTSTDAGIRGGNPLCETYNCSHDGDPDWLAVAYIGQMPVLIDGPVNEGDYIIPGGNNDGRAKAVNYDYLKNQPDLRTIGTALESTDKPFYEQKSYDPKSDYEPDREMYKMLKRKGKGHIINVSVNVHDDLPAFMKKGRNL